MKPIHTFSVIPSLPRKLKRCGPSPTTSAGAGATSRLNCSAGWTAIYGRRPGTTRCCCWAPSSKRSWKTRPRTMPSWPTLSRRIEPGAVPAWPKRRGFAAPMAPAAMLPLIAYFSAEFGLTECLSIFAGGLGILAGDHLKSASDLGVPLVGVGLLYQQGISASISTSRDGSRKPTPATTFIICRSSLVADAGRTAARGERRTRRPHRCMRRSGRCRWDACHSTCSTPISPSNARPEDRDITDQLYGGDREMRIRQEILLGIGGYRALQLLGLHPTVFHMNEGHAAFLCAGACPATHEDARAELSRGHASLPQPAWFSPPTLPLRPGTTISAGAGEPLFQRHGARSWV